MGKGESVKNPNPSPVYQFTAAPAVPGPTIDPLYFVRSDTNPNLFYTVGQVDGRCACGQRIAGLMHCSCPDHVHRARDCKHVRAVLAGQAVPATVKGAPLVRPTLPPPAAYRTAWQDTSDADLWGDAGAAATRGVAQLRAVAS